MSRFKSFLAGFRQDPGRAKRAPLLAAMLLLAGVATAPMARAQESVISLGVGAFDVFDDETAAQFEGQWRGPRLLWWIQPMVGASGTTDGAFYLYAGISVDIPLGSRLVLRPSFAPGYYNEGSGKDLGYDLEFKSAIELSYRFENNARLGLEFSHRSNAGLGDDNPGEESLMLTFAYPLGR